MRTLKLLMRAMGFAPLVIWALSLGTIHAQTPGRAPEILSVEVDGQEVVVEVFAPKGVKRLILESREKIGAGAWIPRGVYHVDEDRKDLRVTFRIAVSDELAMLRARSLDHVTTPAKWYQGNSSHVSEVSEYEPAAPAYGFAEDDSGTFRAGGQDVADSRDVEESDIWRFAGDTLYFFNQRVGLQVIDLTVPRAPELLGSYDAPAVGEQMYVLDSGYVVLLVNDWCHRGNASTGVKAVVLDVTDGRPSLVEEFLLDGVILDSRLVGDVLYLATRANEWIVDPNEPDSEGHYSWTVRLTSIDLGSPESGRVVDSLTFEGTDAVASATSSLFFLANREWLNVGNRWTRRTTVEVVDISDPFGTMESASTLEIGGYVSDKFKMNLHEDVFTVVSEVSGSGVPVHTEILTFDLSEPTRPRRLGELQLAEGERLFATRFTGDRAYVVTFERIDPLWILDLSDPTKPTILGELEIPGWSTFIQPLENDRLITIGIDNVDGWRAAVQLFDVSDASAPALLSKAPLGAEFSWSEANSDEKAFRVLESEGMVLVPFSAWAGRDGEQGVRIIDFDDETLTPRGLIEHHVQPRRATSRNGLIYSISNEEALTVDATDRDAPELVHRLELASTVDSVIPYGDHLVLTEQGYSPSQTTLRVVSTADPGQTISETVVGEDRWVADLTARGDTLYVVTLPRDAWRWVSESDSKEEELLEAVYDVQVAVYDLTSLPSLVRTHSISQEIEPFPWDMSLDAISLGDHLLTWTPASHGGYFPGPFFFRDDIAIGRGYPYFADADARFLTFNVENPQEPVFVSDYTIPAEEERDYYSGARVGVGSLVFLSRQQSRWIEEEPKSEVEGSVDSDEDPLKRVPIPDFRPRGVWVTQYFLEVIDFVDPRNPTRRLPVSVPGALVDVLDSGETLLTDGHHVDEEGESDGSRWLDLSAYDGVGAYLLDSWNISSSFGAVQSLGFGALVGERARSEDGDIRNLLALGVDEDGSFVALSRYPVGENAWNFATLNDLALIQSRSGNDFDILEYADPNSPSRVGGLSAPGCLYIDPSRAVGDLDSGIWAPMGQYGVIQAEFE